MTDASASHPSTPPPRSDATVAPKPARSVGPLRGLLPFLRPYRSRIALAGVFLVLAAVATLVFPAALRALIDQGLVAGDPGERVMARRTTSSSCSPSASRWACSLRRPSTW